MHLLGHRKLLATPFIYNCWLVTTYLSVGWVNPMLETMSRVSNFLLPNMGINL